MRDEDVDAAVRTIYGEARGESFEGKKAVAHVIFNRHRMDLHADGKRDWWGETIAEVCCKPYQFSCWNSGDPNRAKIEAIESDTAEYRVCFWALRDAEHEHDPTRGGTHYHVVGISPLPEWARGKTPAVTIGRHVFYNDIEGAPTVVAPMQGA